MDFTYDFYDDQPSPSTTGNDDKQKKSKKLNPQTYRPFTIKQIKMAENRGEEGNGASSSFINNEEITHVAVIGVVRSMTRQEAYTSYVIEDGTGAIDVVNWESDINYTNAMSDDSTITIDTYVRASGRIHFYSNRTANISALKVPIIIDFNEITHHFLEAVYYYLNASGKMDVFSIMSGVKIGGNERENKEALVARSITECSHTMAGAYIPAVVVQLKDHLSETKVMEILGNLESTGRLYYTSDREHIKLTD